MPQITLTVSHEAGLHARPASLFIKTAKQFECQIEVCHQDRVANAKSMLSVLTLGAGPGVSIVVRADGRDADEALAAIKALVDSDFADEA